MKFPNYQNNGMGKTDIDKNGICFYLGKSDCSYLGKIYILWKWGCIKLENDKKL